MEKTLNLYKLHSGGNETKTTDFYSQLRYGLMIHTFIK